MNSPLKPCMCGSKNLIGPEWDQVAISNPEKRYRIRCNECHIRMFGDTKESVVETWNTRPGEDALQAEIDRLKLELASKEGFSDAPF